MTIIVAAFATWTLWDVGQPGYAVLTGIALGALIGVHVGDWIRRL